MAAPIVWRGTVGAGRVSAVVNVQGPNFFIVGAAKCGTTALHAYLSDHPQIFMSDPKEPGFWAEDLPGHQRMETLEQYLALFAEARPEHRAVGEATPFYIYSDVALQRIREFAPEARLVVMFRNPVEQVRAFHNQARYDGTEDVDDFETAWRLQEARARGDRLPRWNRDAKLLQYRALAGFGRQYERLLALWPRAQVHPILTEDLAGDTRGVYKAVLDFLHVDDDGRSDFDRVNESHEHWIPSLGRWLSNPPPALLAVNDLLKKATGLEETKVRHLLKRTRRRDPTPERLRAELAEVFAADVALLGRLLDRDLSHWVG